ncbi:MAG TPA: ATP-binding protein [Smithellaceae bacterium]|nr:ATP-binding protein [Smithellaceae bacterium]HPL66949.1 ATP-binding protein [Smithellaceae bacterium]
MRKKASHRKSLFVSSVQKELEIERRAVKNFVQNDPLLRRFFDVFLFEDLPARDRRSDDVYLEEVEHCDLYIGLFGNEYGSEDAKGVSPTEHEFDLATAKGKCRLIFVKGADDKSRHPKMLKLIRKAGSQLIRRRIADANDLTAALYAALVDYMEQIGDLRTLPFDASACPRATLSDLPQEKIQTFLELAKRERNYPLPVKTVREKALTHLNLLDDGRPTHAAVLLFGSAPQRFLPTSEVKCMHYHGTTVSKPIPSYQIYKGTAFELVDQAVDFVLSKINRHIGTRAQSVQAPATFELPREAVTEAIVNAVAHRDYTSNASVQVMLFADRLEVWNPGELPPSLTPERLREPHASIPRNPLIAEPLYLVRYIEKAGSGTLDMIERCRQANLPPPAFEERAGQFVTTLWRDWLTDEVMSGLGLNERQQIAVTYLKAHGKITNKEYQQLTGVTDRTILREFKELLAKGLLEKVGQTGRATHYVLIHKTRHKPDKMPLVSETRHKPDKQDMQQAKGKGAAKRPKDS